MNKQTDRWMDIVISIYPQNIPICNAVSNKQHSTYFLTIRTDINIIYITLMCCNFKNLLHAWILEKKFIMSRGCQIIPYVI